MMHSGPNCFYFKYLAQQIINLLPRERREILGEITAGFFIIPSNRVGGGGGRGEFWGRGGGSHRLDREIGTNICMQILIIVNQGLAAQVLQILQLRGKDWQHCSAIRLLRGKDWQISSAILLLTCKDW